MADTKYAAITLHKLTKAKLDRIGAQIANGQQIGSKPLRLSYEEIIDVLITEREQRLAKGKQHA